jgi:hypothetical protein
MIYNSTIELSSVGGEIIIDNVLGLNAEIFESIYGSSVYRLFFSTNRVDVWNSIIRDQGKSQLAVKISGVPDSGESLVSELKTIRIKQFVCKIIGDVAEIELVGHDEMFYLQHSCRRASYKQMTVKEIVTQIAKAAKLVNPKPEIGDFSTAKFTLYQCGMSDYDFIKDVLIPRASKDPVLFYMKNGNTLVFKKRESKKDKNSLEFAYRAEGNKNSIGLDSFTTTFSIDTSNFLIDGVTFDRGKSQILPYFQEYTSDKLPKDPLVSGSVLLNPPVYGKITNFVTDISEKNIQEVLAMRTRPQFPFTMQRIAIPCYLLPQCEPGIVASIVTDKVDGKKLSFSGDYLVYAVYHRIFTGGGDQGTIVFLERRGVKS